MADVKKPKSNSVVTYGWSDGGVGPVVTFRVLKGSDDGRSDVELAFDTRKISDAVRAGFHRNGVVQRLVDLTAMSKETVHGQPAPASAKVAKLRRAIEHYESGADEWAIPRAEAIVALDSILLAAVAEGLGIDPVVTRARVEKGAGAKGISPKEYLALAAATDRIAPIVARMRQERTNVSGEDIIDEMLDQE